MNSSGYLRPVASKREISLRAIIALQNHIVSSGLRLEAVMAACVRELPIVLGCDGAVIELREGDAMVYRAASGSAAGSIGLRLPMEGSLSGLCVSQREPLYAHDTEDDERVDRAACRRLAIRSMICYPLMREGECVGVCKAFSHASAAFDENAADALGLIASVIAASIENAVRFAQALDEGKVDKLTGLGNRRAFDEDLAAAIARARRTSAPLTLALLDLDKLKAINDTYGHVTGDDAIANFGAALARGLRSGDQAFRIGGDEFCVIFFNAARGEGSTLMDRLRDAVTEIRIVDRPLSFSAGLSELEADDNATELVERADRAMYEQKRALRAQFVARADHP